MIGIMSQQKSSSSVSSFSETKKIKLAEVFSAKELNNPYNAQLFLAIKWINSVLNDDVVDETGLPSDILSDPKVTVTPEYRNHFTIEHKNLFRSIRTFIINTYRHIKLTPDEYRAWLTERKFYNQVSLPLYPQHDLDILVYAIRFAMQITDGHQNRNTIILKSNLDSRFLTYLFLRIPRKGIVLDEKGCDVMISQHDSQRIDTTGVENLLENNAVLTIDSVDRISGTGFGAQCALMRYTWSVSFDNIRYSPPPYGDWAEIFHYYLLMISASSSKTSDSYILKQLPKQQGCKFYNSDTIGYTLAYSPNNKCAMVGRISSYHFIEQRFEWKITPEEYEIVINKHINKRPSFWNKCSKSIPFDIEKICDKYFFNPSKTRGTK